MVEKNKSKEDENNNKKSSISNNYNERNATTSIRLPCDHFDHEYKQCSSLMGRIENYYRGS